MRLALALHFVFTACIVGSRSKEIKALPGLTFCPNFRHYSGYLQVTKMHSLFYWFVESQNDPANDPLIFWVNGGPGCSALDGLLNEMGPYLTNNDGKTLRENPNAWNKFANVVYLDAPAGVGFPYTSDGNTTTNDDQTADENYEAIKLFLKEFPTFRKNPLFIMSESYGGIYIPTWAERIIDGQKEFQVNFKGIAIGNGYVSVDSTNLYLNTYARYNYLHGLVDGTIWKTLEDECCGGQVSTCDVTKLNASCTKIVDDIHGSSSYGLGYDLYEDCPNRNWTVEPAEPWDCNKCSNPSATEGYLNRTEVREALHIPPFVQPWTTCDGENYTGLYDEVSALVKKVVEAKIPVLLYYGDTDTVCNFLLGQEFSASLGLRLKQRKHAWYVDDRIAGLKTEYEGLTFITVLGAGHQAPKDRARQTAHAIKQFVNDQPI